MKKYKTIEVYETELCGEIIVNHYDGSPCEVYRNSKIENIINSKNLEGYYVSHYSKQDIVGKLYIMTKEIN